MTKRAEAGRATILLAVYNGAQYLQPQLDSFARQSFADWDLLVGDDGSSDGSPEIISAFARNMQDKGHDVTQVKGPAMGSSALHFLSLLAQSSGTWVAFSDQDDVWLEDKLERAVKALAHLDPARPALYCSRTWVTDVDLGNQVLSRCPRRAPGFKNALVQNIAAGNTIVLNRAAAELARRAAGALQAIPDLPAHDWWLYQLITGAGGQIVYDDIPTLYYRQHAENVIGANHGVRAALARLKGLFDGRYRGWNTANIAALRACSRHLLPDNRDQLEQFATLRDKRAIGRLWMFSRLGLYRQSALTQAALWLAAALGRL